MKFRRIKKFVGSSLGDAISYLTGELNKFCTDIQVVINKLTFLDNFDSFSENVSIASGASVNVPNRIGASDLDWIVTRITGDSRIVETTLTKTLITFKNVGATDLTARICFFKR